MSGDAGEGGLDGRFLAVVLVYLAALAVVGVRASRRVTTQNQFMVADRRTPAWMLVATLICTWIGSGSIIAGAGLAYRVGLSQLWMGAGAWAGIACVYFLAGKVRRLSEYTLPDLLERRYHPAARLLGTITIVIAYTTIAGYQFRGMGIVLELVAGVPMAWGVTLTAALVAVYTCLAGMVSVIRLDVLNGAMILAGILVAVPMVIAGVGGWDGVRDALPADHFTLFGPQEARHMVLLGEEVAPPGWIWALGVFLPVFLLLLGESNMYQKFFSAESESAARRAVVGWIAGTIVVETLLCVLAVAGSSRFTSLGEQGRTERIILHMARHGEEVGLPFWAGALLMCAAVAIIISTANAFLLSPSTSLARDVVQRFLAPGIGDRALLAMQRLFILLLAALAYMMLQFFPTVLAMAFTAYTFVGAGLTPAILAAFLWKRATAAGGVASIAGGMAVTLAITVVNGYHQVSHGRPWLETDYIVIPAAAASILLLVTVSLLTPPPAEERWRPFAG
ncbi:MAG TPA: sodium:solute symporter family protein [Candidatus Polarisedimenticolia bacterium]|nr:sodium:solute symporter family protein [Candidatus Polarisedimenticolia bacterium]